jgi:hypothetical protein
MARTPRTVGLVALLLLAAFAPPAMTASLASIQAATPTTVSLVAGEEQIVAVEVLDEDGNPVPDTDVQWQVPAAGPSAVIAGPFNDQEGFSVVGVRSTGGLGTYEITASIAGLTPVTFSITNVVGPLTTLELAGGGTQSTAVNTAFAEPLRIRAVDVDRNPLASVTITLQPAAVGPSATLSALTPQTDATGQVSVIAIANPLGGAHVIQASALKPGGGVALAQIRLSNLVLVPGNVTLVGGNTQEAPLESEFALPLEVGIRTSGGVAIANVAVEFAGPLAGPGLGSAFAGPGDPVPIPGGGRAFTDVNGVARLTVFANAELGSYGVTARVVGLAAGFGFSLTNSPRVPAAIRANGTSDVVGEKTPPGQRFTNLAFRVVDGTGAGAPDIEVTLEPPTTGPSVVPDQLSLVTDFDGWARTQGTANAISGTYSLTARVATLANPGVLLLQNRPAGYDVGQQLADPVGFDHAGQQRSLRSFLSGGTYLVLDVCAGWCAVCRLAQPDGQAAKSALAAMGIPVAVVPLLSDSNTTNGPSGQSDAAAWRTQFSISDPVLHVSGAIHSPLWEAAWFVLDVVRPAFPTYLLVSPDGTVLARHVGALFEDDLVEFVTSHVPPALSISDVTVAEGNGGASVTVSRSRGGAISSVNYATAPGSAGSGDFSPTTGTLQFGSGDLSATITVPITGDPIDEPTESFSVTLSNAVGAVIVRGQASVTITDDDPAPRVTIDDVHIAEGDVGPTQALIPVQLDRPSASAVSINFATALGTASAKDFVPVSGSVVFAPGQTAQQVRVTITGDTLIEIKETFLVNLSLAGGTAIIADAQAVATIVDDDIDPQAPVIAAKPDVIVEVKMAPSSTVAVSFTSPAAKDNRDGTIATTCAPPSGSRFGYGRTTVTCTAEDRVGNVGTGTFGVVVQLPTIPGAVFAASDPDGPALTDVHRGHRVIVRVNAGAFKPRARVTLLFVDSSGRTFVMEHDHASNTGALDVATVIPWLARLGPGQVLAESEGVASEYDRAWLVTVSPRTWPGAP